MKRKLLVLALATSLVACGGSDDDVNKPNPSPTPTQPSKTGVFTDGVISGVSYKTNKGFMGTTNSAGEFKYDEGDQVTFSIGNVQLGDTVIAQTRITPLDLATDVESRTNLLVFLQSLDNDAKHENGIQISEKAIAAVTGLSINFKQSSDAFANDANVKQVLTKAGTTAVTAEQAKQNFQKAFYQDIAGVWQYTAVNSKQTVDVMLYINADGQYYLGQFTPADHAGKPGIEVGQLNWNSVDGSVKPSINIDTNSEWGLSHPVNKYDLKFDGTQLIIDEQPQLRDSTVQFSRVLNKANSIVGSWIFKDDANQVFSFFDNGYYVMLDPAGDTFAIQEGRIPCSHSGIEYGKYTLNGHSLLIHNVSVDTNACAGINDESGTNTLPFTLESNKLSLGTDKDAVTFNRIP